MVHMGCELDVIVCLVEDLKELPTDRTTELYHKSGSEYECKKDLPEKA